MAIQPYIDSIEDNDNLYKVYKDLDPNFKRHPITKDVINFQGRDAIKTSIMNLVKMTPGSRIGRPEVGGAVMALLFEPMNNLTTNRIQSEIESVITTYEPRAELIKVEVRPDEDNNEYIINILFAIAESSEPIEFETYLQRVR